MNKTNSSSQRPLSPHLQVYRLPYNALMSITGRAFGVGLSGTLMIVFAWFSLVVWYPGIYDLTTGLLDNPFTQYALLLWAGATFFYLGNGIRHVLWDFVIGVNEESGIRTGNIVLVISALLTIGLWFAIYLNAEESVQPDITIEEVSGGA